MTDEVLLLDRMAAAKYLGLPLRTFQDHVQPHVKVIRVGSKPMFTHQEGENTMSLFYKVSDGARTRDNRNHNPTAKTWLQVLIHAANHIQGGKKRVRATVSAPGAFSGVVDPMAPLRRWGCP